MNLQDALAKIRPHTNSGLAHQKKPATLLLALESTLESHSSDLTPTAYFAALITTLEGVQQRKETSFNDGDVLPATLYLLALVIAHVPHPIIRANLSTVLRLIKPLVPAIDEHAPALRSLIAILGCTIQAVDLNQLDAMRPFFAALLEYTVDPRPKVRKKAADAIIEVLQSPPMPLSAHPLRDAVGEWSCALLIAHKKPVDVNTEKCIHLLAFLKAIVEYYPQSAMPLLIPHLLALPRLANPYLTQLSYTVLSLLLERVESSETFQPAQILSAILAAKPSATDAMLGPSWLTALSHATRACYASRGSEFEEVFKKVWNTSWAFLESPDAATRKAAQDALCSLVGCISESMIDGLDEQTPFWKIVDQITRSLTSFSFLSAIPSVLIVLATVISRLSSVPAHIRGTTVPLISPVIHRIGGLRTSKNFDHKEEADLVLATAMKSVGVDVVLSILPLNLLPGDRQNNAEPRAYLLPLLPVQHHPTPLAHFVSYFVPLSEKMFEMQLSAAKEGEAKVWSVLVDQIWNGLSGYCCAPVDLLSAFNPVFAQLLTQLLYSQPGLRPSILKSLRVVVESNLTVLRSAEADEDTSSDDGQPLQPTIPLAEAKQNVQFLKQQAGSWLAVLFNVFGSVEREGRGMVGDVISVWAAIAEPLEIGKAYLKVAQILNQSLTNKTVSQNNRDAQAKATVTAQTMLDILILVVPQLSPPHSTELFATCLAPALLNHSDGGVQKRTYKVLWRLITSQEEVAKGEMAIEEVFRQLGPGDTVAPGAKKDRLSLISAALPLVPKTSLHLIATLLPEAVLSTKEPSEKARNAGFELLVAMGHKMSQGGIVKRSQIEGMDVDDGEAGEGQKEVPATVEEFMTMVAAGLAGATPHSISASVTAISRLMFEFKDDISPTMQTEILSTLLVFLDSTNREIVKSTLGFIKLAVHTLAVTLIRPHLPQLVPALLAWAHDHKNHFKAKVRHIFERMIRRFGWESVYGAAANLEGNAAEEGKKILLSIKKRKDRAKKKKANDNGDEDEGGISTKRTTGNAFEDIVYGSESELGATDDEDVERPEKSQSGAEAKERKRKKGNVRIQMDNEHPMDLLQGAAGHVSANRKPRKVAGQDAASFKTDAGTGRLLINEDGNSEDDDDVRAADVAGAAYRETITSVDGFTRGANGRVKFNKDTKKRRRANEDMEDVEMEDAIGNQPDKQKAKRRTEVRLGQEFKAKKAGGDVKKGGLEPYAYLSLAQAAGTKRGGGTKYRITGKK